MTVLTKKQLLMLHSQLIAETGGVDGLRDEGMLESAMNAPFQSFAGAVYHSFVLIVNLQILYCAMSCSPFAHPCIFPIFFSPKRIVQKSPYQKNTCPSAPPPTFLHLTFPIGEAFFLLSPPDQGAYLRIIRISPPYYSGAARAERRNGCRGDSPPYCPGQREPSDVTGAWRFSPVPPAAALSQCTIG